MDILKEPKSKENLNWLDYFNVILDFKVLKFIALIVVITLVFHHEQDKVSTYTTEKLYTEKGM